jgi:anti-sigma factor RsiW
MIEHLAWDVLNDLVDDLLPPDERAAATGHLRTCQRCSDAFADLGATVGAAGSLTPRVDPPDEIWRAIRSTIESRKVAQLGDRPARPRGWWITPSRAAAASLLLVAGTAAVTTLVVRSETASPVEAMALTPLPVAWQVAERGYQASVLELREQLAAMHDELSPATIQAVEQSLSTIDVAIAEGREAPLRDPANAALPELLASNYRQKIDLLRRATQIPSTS